MSYADVLTNGCLCPACKEMRALPKNLGAGADIFRQLWTKHCKHTDPDYGMSDTAIIKRDVKEILRLLKK